MAGKVKPRIIKKSDRGRRAGSSANSQRLSSRVKRKAVASPFSQEELSFVRRTLARVPNVYDRSETREAIRQFNKGDIVFFVYQLGVVDFYKDREGRHSAPYGEFGEQLWNNCRRQLRDVICGDSDAYQQERARLQSSAENALIVLVPLVLSALNLPPAASGVAIVLSLMILKIGFKAFCATAGDLAKLRGKPGQMCVASGRYLNVQNATIESVLEGTRFPDGPAKSEWFFFEKLPGS